jgi:outer membrane autotransporter protein
VTDNSLLFDFRAIKTGNAVDLVLQAAQASGGDGGGGGGGSTQVVNAVVSTSNHPGLGAARVIDAVIAANPGSELASAFVPLTTQQEVSDAVSQTLPLLTGGSMMAANAAFSGINRVVQARIEANRGLSSGDTFLGDGKVWMKPFGSWAGQDNIAGVSGYKASTSGFALGADGTVSPHTRMGAAFAYANSSTDSRSVVAPQRNSHAGPEPQQGPAPYRADQCHGQRPLRQPQCPRGRRHRPQLPGGQPLHADTERARGLHLGP